ncbi:MAG: DUF1572 family protein [Planctomycetaceae bacterium]
MKTEGSGADFVVRAFLDAAIHRLQASTAKIVHCVEQLDDEQLWWRPTPSQNSIGNLVLHLCGNLRQWIIAGVGGAPDVRDRPREFAERGPLPRMELRRRLHSCIGEAGDALASADCTTLLVPCRIQGFETTPLTAIMDSVTHFQGHTQEIISLTRQQLGESYRFHWTPSTPEQMSGNAT